MACAHPRTGVMYRTSVVCLDCDWSGPTSLPVNEGAKADGQLPVNLTELLQRVEDAYVDAAMRQSNGRKSEAAKLLGINRTTLVEKLRRRAGMLTREQGRLDHPTLKTFGG